MQRALLVLAFGLALVTAQPFQPGQNLAPLGMHLTAALRCDRPHRYGRCCMLRCGANQCCLDVGNLRTSDFGGPYNLSLLSVQEAEVKCKYHHIIAAVH